MFYPAPYGGTDNHISFSMKLSKSVLDDVDLRRPSYQKVLISGEISSKIRGQPMSQTENMGTVLSQIFYNSCDSFLIKLFTDNFKKWKTCGLVLFIIIPGSQPFCNLIGHIIRRPIFFTMCEGYSNLCFLGGVPEDLVGEVHTSIPL
jgi:hypothetical protein